VSETEQNLTDKQRLFIEHYLSNGLNGADAARRAGYSEDTARFQASRLLTNVNIRAEIDRRLAEVAMGANEVLARLTAQARADMGDFIKVDKRGKVSLDLKRAQREGLLHLVHKLGPTQFGMKLELYDAQAALALLGKAHKLFDQAAAGTADDPIHQVSMSVEDWRAERAKRREQLATTMAAFEDESGDE
jgi:hypothetical protein